MADESNKTTEIDAKAEARQLRKQAYTIAQHIQSQQAEDFESAVRSTDYDAIAALIATSFNDIVTAKNSPYPAEKHDTLREMVFNEILGLGPLDPLLRDPEVTEIMVNGFLEVYVERFGHIEEVDITFQNEEHLRAIIDNSVAPVGRRVDEDSPMVDARLPNGYRINATIPPLALNGSILTIRKFADSPLTVESLIMNDSITRQAVDFLKACVEARINIVISGGAGTGKTTLLNTLSSFIPTKERIITIEDTAEMQLPQKHVVRLEKRPLGIDGKGEVTIRQLVINALRMRPDRIIVGEVRGGEALDMLQAMNTGHDGSMTTVHSNSPRDTLRRIETMVLMAGMELPSQAIREQITSAIQLIVHLSRFRDGTRKVVNIVEVHGLEINTIVMQDIFEFRQTGFEDGKVQGQLEATGLPPGLLERFNEFSIELPEGTLERPRHR